MNASSPLLAREPRCLDHLLQFENYIAVGANSGGDQVRAWLAQRGKKTLAFADLSVSQQGTSRNGLEVLAPEACLPLADRTAFVIGTVRQKEVAEILIGHLGVDPSRVFPFVNPMFAAHYAPSMQQRLSPQHGRIRGCLADEDSRAYFDRVTAFYRTLDARYLTPQPKRIGQYGYDAPGANPQPGATIVDCGAFTGDTFPEFLAATQGECRIYALEAFPPNFQRLGISIAQGQLEHAVIALPLAIAREKGVIRMSGEEAFADGCAGIGAVGASAEHVVACDSLDNQFFEKQIAIDYLKMDIEGAEPDALAGGEKTLRRYRPVTAVAAYHKPEHLAEIADFLLKTLAPCKLYAAHDPNWVFHIHYIAVPDERASGIRLR